MVTRLIAAIGILLVAGPSQAVLISVTNAAGGSNIDIAEGTSTVDVFVRIIQEPSDAGVNQIAGADFAILVGDGGPLVGGTDVVPIVAVNYTMTAPPGPPGPNSSIWDPLAPNLDQTVGPGVLPNSSAAILSVSSNVAGANAMFGPPGPGPEVLARLTLDTSGLAAGDSFVISAFSGIGPAAAASRFVDNGMGGFNVVPLTLANGGNAVLSVSAVPEPGSFALLSLGIVAFGARRRSRRRQTELTS